jgi:hypothetical protein
LPRKGLEGGVNALGKGDETFLSPFSFDANHAGRRVDVAPTNGARFAHAKTSAVKQKNESFIVLSVESLRLHARSKRLKKSRRFIDGEMVGKSMRNLGTVDVERKVATDQLARVEPVQKAL